MTNYHDWDNIMKGEMDRIQIPDSCARGEISMNGTEIFEEGCFDRMAFVVSQSAMLVATGAVTVAFVQVQFQSELTCCLFSVNNFVFSINFIFNTLQLLGVICAFMLAKTIRQAKSQRLARRWQLQQNLGIYNKPTPLTPYNPPYVQLNDETKPRNVNNDPHFTYLPNSPSVN